METPIAVTIPNAVRLTGISRTKLYQEINERKITAIKSGRRTLIPFDELQAYLANLPKYQAGA